MLENLPQKSLDLTAERGILQLSSRRLLQAFSRAEAPVAAFNARPAFAFDCMTSLGDKRPERTGQLRRMIYISL